MILPSLNAEGCVRAFQGVILVLLLFGQVGCGLFNRQTNPPPRPAPPRPVPDIPIPGEGASTDSSLPPEVNGLLAGQVMDSSLRGTGQALIQVVDLRDTKAAAPLEVEVDKNGYFMIEGLTPGRDYRLTARVRDGRRVLLGTVEARPPNPRLAIYVVEDHSASPASPPPPTPPAPTSTDNPGRASAALQPPVNPATPPPGNIPGDGWTPLPPPVPPESAPPRREPPNPPPPAPPPSGQDFAPVPGGSPYSNPEPSSPEGSTPALDPARITIKDDANRGPPRVNIPPPRVPAPPTLTIPPGDWQLLPETTPPPAPNPREASLPPARTPVPSCVLLGNRLDNFALYGLDGQPWEYRQHRKGRLVLLDFWYTACLPCRQAIPHLRDLQARYGSYGLQVVGIAYEQGSQAEKIQKLRAFRARTGINYTLLLGGGGPGPCPVQTQFEVSRFPTLVLLDESGQIIWRREGLNERARFDLENEIRKRLRIR
jgi:thiol-disulfide isomerase/thioredoxin